MKKVILITIGIALSIVSHGQQSPKQKEVGIGISTWGTFGAFYRVGSPKSLWRFTVLNRYGNLSQFSAPDIQTKYSGFNVTVQAGKEFRKSITDKFDFRFGGDVMFHYSYFTRAVDDMTMTDNDSYSKARYIGPGVNGVVGFNYKIKRILIGAEALPCFLYTKGRTITQENGIETITNFSKFGHSFTGGLLSLAYRF